MEVRRLTADKRLQFNTAADASNRAVGAGTVAASTAATRQEDDATQAIQQQIPALRAIVDALSYNTEMQLLNEFEERFEALRTLDRTILDVSISDDALEASLGRKRLLTAARDDSLRALQVELQKHDVTATR